MTKKTFSKICLLAGLALVTSAAFAAVSNDAAIRINRALNSPTITVKYDGAKAAVVELRINGRSIATRDVDPDVNSGETNFSIDLSTLTPGENRVEVRLFDEAGKLVGSQNSTITIEDHTKSPIFLETPAVGQTVQGTVKVDVGFGREMRNAYVSFFVNGQFRSMSNVPPFTYWWDTTRERNGWHELEAWVVDAASNTFKTRPTKVFVNNPGGRTERVTPVDVRPTAGTLQPPVGTSQTDLRTTSQGTSQAVIRPTDPTIPNTTPVTTSTPPRASATGTVSGVKPGTLGDTIAAGPQHMTPTGQRTIRLDAEPDIVPTRIDVDDRLVVTTPIAAVRVRIDKGTRLAASGPYSIMLDSRFVAFDVNPRIENGVPLTPFRHLIEHAGGEVEWEHDTKIVTANADGRTIWFQIGQRTARINDLPVDLEIRPFIERGRSIVPLSFIKDTLDVEIDYDPATGHVLITTVARRK